MSQLDQLTLCMMEHDRGDPRRIQHFLKVHALARLIGRGEGLDERTLLTLEAAALTHDIGIRPAEQKYGTCSGPLQEQEGPVPARTLLRQLGFADDVVDRVCWLIAHHHTYDNVQGDDYRILLEADFLVNLYESSADRDALLSAYARIFRTATGRRIFRMTFNVDK